MFRRGFLEKARARVIGSALTLFCLPALSSPAFAEGAGMDEVRDKVEGVVAWASVDSAGGVHGDFDAGAILAINRDLSVDGFLLRAGSRRVSASEGGLGQDWDAMAGYQFHLVPATVSVFAGADFQKQPGAHCWAADYGTGLKLAASLETGRDAPFSGTWEGDYSTILGTYWSRARAGYNWQPLLVGPEAIFQGNDNFRQERAGVFASIPLERVFGYSAYSAIVELSTGYQWETAHCKDGVQCESPIGGRSDLQGNYLSVGMEFSF